MVTRQEKQIVDDLVRFINIMNDLFDVNSYMLQGVDQETGGVLQKKERVGETLTFRDFTLDELKQLGKKNAQNILGYANNITNFLSGTDMLNITMSAFTAVGVDFNTTKNEFNVMKTGAAWIIDNIDSILSKEALKNTIVAYIDDNIPKLTLIRRSWCLGGV